MRATLMWTINDFSAYGMVSGWSIHGKLACSYCMENNKEFTLTNRGKTSFFYYHQYFLPINHRYRKNRNDFFVGRVEKDVAPPHLSGEELLDVEKGNIFNIVMDVNEKTKNNIKAIMDIALFYNCKNMELVFDGSRIAKLRVGFVLEKNT